MSSRRGLGFARPSGVVAATRAPEGLADRGDRSLGRGGDKVHVCGHDMPSLAKSAVAFRRISRSWRSVRFSRRSAAGSSRSAVVRGPAPPPPHRPHRSAPAGPSERPNWGQDQARSRPRTPSSRAADRAERPRPRVRRSTAFGFLMTSSWTCFGTSFCLIGVVQQNGAGPINTCHKHWCKALETSRSPPSGGSTWTSRVRGGERREVGATVAGGSQCGPGDPC